MSINCAGCARELDNDEPFASFDFCINRDAGDHRHVLEGRELMKFCIPCGYDRVDTAYSALMGIESIEWVDIDMSTVTIEDAGG